MNVNTSLEAAENIFTTTAKRFLKLKITEKGDVSRGMNYEKLASNKP